MRCSLSGRLAPFLFIGAATACTSPPGPAPTVASAPPPAAEPPLAKTAPPPAPAPTVEAPPAPLPPVLSRPWAYVLESDHGVRSDSGGRGGFLAPRTHGRHNGLDLLAPIGSKTLAPCDGKARAGKSRSFGNWVQVVCAVPKEVGEGLWVSLFYSHLDTTLLRGREWHAVRRGKVVGTVGKSGNASGSSIAPHLHFEVVLHDSEDDASAENHSGRNQRNTTATDAFLEKMAQDCLGPNGFARKSGPVRRARRVDPFLVLSCLSDAKPDFAPASGTLAKSGEAWHEHYVAETFDVDRGRDDPAR